MLGSAAPAAAAAPAEVSARARALVRREIVTAAADLVALPVRAGRYLARREALQAEFAAVLSTSAEPAPVPACDPPRARPLTVFVSCAEVSGELHAANAVREMQRRVAASGAPAPRFVGLGGSRLAEAGVELIEDTVRTSRMGFSAVIGALPWYVDLLRRSASAIERERPDVLLAVDSPALHVPLGRIARGLATPVVHFVTPQYWGWAPWRVARYHEAVDLALSILPFEPAWFAAQGVRVAHVGHPILEELENVPRGDPDRGRDLVLLPGSRRSVIRRNLGWMLRAVAPLVRDGIVAGVRIPHGRADLAELLRSEVARAGAADWAHVETGGLHAALARARAAFSVSGTVLLDVLHHELPMVVVYRLGSRVAAEAKDHLLTAPYFASVNLLAGRDVVPEFCFHGAGPVEAVRAALSSALQDPAWRMRCRAGLREARRRLGPPGAAGRAAGHALAVACRARAEGGP